MPHIIVDLLDKAAQANRTDRFRHGSLISLPALGSLIAAGDIHGHRRNFERLVAFADLDNNSDRHVVLQEIIHGGPTDAEMGCLSYKLLFDVARYKLSYPNHIHIIMGNHDIAFISNSEIIKDGREMNRSMRLALDREFGDDSPSIKEAIGRFLLSQPLAVRCDNRIWLSHSLPSDRYLDKFDHQVIQRELEAKDCERRGSAYLLTWGRNISTTTFDKIGQLFDVDIFILGHQPQPQGWTRLGKNCIIIASDHDHGCLLPINLAESCTVDRLVDSIVPLASIL
jgi:hypothetical protein